MVDEIVSEVKRPDLTSEIARYVNQTIRELHFSNDRNAAQFYRSNLRESQVSATSESAFVWAIPSPTRFQKMSAVCYLDQFDSNGKNIWPEETTPGRHLNSLTHFYYQTGGAFVFSGFGGLASRINLAWFEFPASLTYFTPSCRPMEINSYGQEIFAEAWVCIDAQDDARLLCTNWLLSRWKDVISEGVRAKVYKRVSDTERARTSYSMYSQLRQGLMTSESAVLY